MLEHMAGNWWAIALRGALAIIFGVGAFAWPGITLAAVILVFGAYALVDGGLEVLWAIFGRRTGSFPWGALLAGLISLGAGLVAFAWPGLTALALLYLVAAWAILHGIFEIVAAFHLRKELDNEWLLALSGLLSVGLGVLLWIAPGAGILAVLWWIGAVAIVFGILTIALGFRLKGVKERLERGGRTRPAGAR